MLATTSSSFLEATLLYNMSVADDSMDDSLSSQTSAMSESSEMSDSVEETLMPDLTTVTCRDPPC